MQPLTADLQRIPVPATSLVGRSDEIARISTLLARPDVRLVTLTGPGGVGKTRLALRVAHDIDRDGTEVHAVLLAGVPDAADVLPTIARALGVPQDASTPLDDRIARAIDHRDMLLVLDNAEHVVEGLAALPSLLGRCPNLTVLVTSRVLLRLSAEHHIPVEPLAVMPTPDGVAPATALFIERARAVRPDLPLDIADVEAIDDICRRIDGLPLAIELAAARTRLFSPIVLRDRLGERLAELAGGPRDAPERHQTLRATLDWSHDLLGDERALFRRLAVFENGAPYEAVGPVCDLDHRTDALLASLVDQSLVRIVDSPATGPRVRMLQTIREFATEQLALSGDEDAVRDAHAAWFSELAIASPEDVRRTGSPELWAWTLRYADDRENFRAALHRLMDRGQEIRAAQTVAGLVAFWQEFGQYREVRAWLERVVPHIDAAPDATQIWLRRMFTLLAMFDGAPDEAVSHAAAALALAERGGDPREIANGQALLGTAYWKTGRREEGERQFRAAVATIQPTGNTVVAAMLAAEMAHLLIESAELDRAEAVLRDALPVLGPHRPGALQLFQGLLAYVAIRRDRLDEAGELLEGSLAYHRQPPHRQQSTLARRLLHAAWLAAKRGVPETGAELLGAAHATGLQFSEIYSRSTVEDARSVEAGLRARLDDAAFDARIAIGRRMLIPEAIGLALRVARIRDAGDPSDVPVHGLTGRQREILALLVAGRSNAAIAAALFISERTVTTHLTRIYDRLGVASRAEAIARAHQLGIQPTVSG